MALASLARTGTTDDLETTTTTAGAIATMTGGETTDVMIAGTRCQPLVFGRPTCSEKHLVGAHARRDYDDPYSRGGGGGGRGGRYGGGRSGGVRDGSPERRSPTPEGAVPLSKRQRKTSGWDVHAPGCENMSAIQAKQTGASSTSDGERSYSSC